MCLGLPAADAPGSQISIVGPPHQGHVCIDQARIALVLEVQGTSNIVNYGIDKMRRPAAVPAGGRVRLTATLDGLRELPTGGARAVIDLRFDVEGGAKPACTAKVVYVYFP